MDLTIGNFRKPLVFYSKNERVSGSVKRLSPLRGSIALELVNPRLTKLPLGLNYVRCFAARLRFTGSCPTPAIGSAPSWANVLTAAFTLRILRHPESMTTNRIVSA